MRLKRAIQALKKAPIANIEVVRVFWRDRNAAIRNPVDNTMFVIGPVMDIFPTLSLSADPAIMTAPGDMILKNIGNMESSVKTAPMSVSLNSAHNPFFCAVILWAISCVKKDVVKISVSEANMM